jgi:hypothetical protein
MGGSGSFGLEGGCRGTLSTPRWALDVVPLAAG